jgi:hypothetical protein
VLGSLTVPDDGTQSVEVVRVVPLDRLGNVTDLGGPELVTLQSGGTVWILSPDADGDPLQETFVVSDARGVQVELDDPGDRYDDGNDDFLRIEGAGGLMRVDVYLPDPDVDDSGLVDEVDTAIVAAAVELETFFPSFDMDGDGLVSEADVDLVAAHEGLIVPAP